MTCRVAHRAADSLMALDTYTRRMLLSWFMKNVACSRTPTDPGKPLSEDGRIWQYRTGCCRLICLLEETGIVVLAVTYGKPSKL